MTKTWNPSNAMTESDLKIAVRIGAVQEINILQLADTDYAITATINGYSEPVFISTQRTKKEPKIFKHIGRLIEHIKTTYPTIVLISIHFQHQADKLRKKNQEKPN